MCALCKIQLMEYLEKHYILESIEEGMLFEFFCGLWDFAFEGGEISNCLSIWLGRCGLKFVKDCTADEGY